MLLKIQQLLLQSFLLFLLTSQLVLLAFQFSFKLSTAFSLLTVPINNSFHDLSCGSLLSTRRNSHRHNGSFALQHHLQGLDFFHILSEESILRVFVDLRLILNEFSSACISKSAESLVVVVIGWRAGSNHDSLRVSSQRILEQSRQFRISVRNMVCFAVDQSRYHIAQGTQ